MEQLYEVENYIIIVLYIKLDWKLSCQKLKSK